MKILLLKMLNMLGVISLWQYIHSHEIIILMIHGVMSPQSDMKWIPLRSQLSPEKLDTTLKELSKKYNFISLDNALDMISGSTLMKPYSIVLTFDDGYRNHLTHALPILKKHKAPATFYLASGNTDKGEPFWFDRLDYALQQISSPSLEFKVGNETITIDISSREDLIKSFKKLRNTAKDKYQQDLEMLSEISKLIMRLEKESGKSLLEIYSTDNWSSLMNWQEVKQAIDTGLITIGSHTVDHIRLNLVDKETGKNQLSHSKMMIEENTGIPCKHLCYPNGDWSQEVATVVKKCGYKSAVTTDPETNKIGDNQFYLHRINFPVSGNDDEIMATITGFLAYVVRLKNKFFSTL